MQEEIIDIGKTAEILGISKASVRNWLKHGYLKPIDSQAKYFLAPEVLRLKEAIAAGKIDRLKRRANKSRAAKKFMPIEYLKNEEYRLHISRLIEYIKQHDIEKRMAIFVLALNLFCRHGDLKLTEFAQLIPLRSENFWRKSVYTEFQSFFVDIRKISHFGEGIALIPNSKEAEVLENLFNYSLPPERDVLGIVYQALSNEGKKASLGSYFTPPEIVDGIVSENIKSGQKVLDPCCGTGQFLLSFADHLHEPDSILGIDIDPTAVRIARLNLLLRFSEDFRPKIFHLDTLGDLVVDHKSADSFFDLENGVTKDKKFSVWQAGEYDLIATNPPWGAKIPRNTLEKLSAVFPDLTSGESFSYFLRVSLSLVKEGGVLSFVLPEAILNVRTHSDIRKYILDNCRIKRIECLGKRFKNVLSRVIRLDLVKAKPCGGEKVLIRRPGEEYRVAQKRFQSNKWQVMDVYLKKQDEQILRKVLQTKHTTLEGKADWALGIVTGDNRKFLKDKRENGYEPIYKGSDVGAFILKNTETYIKFSPETFQQVAPVEKYRAPEKLIYKFISNIPVFAYDNKGRLTLNSANILIPKMEYPLKVILALFNSSLYRYMYKKKFNTIKILRGDIEQLPLPLWEKEVFDSIIRMVDRVIQGGKEFSVLDDYILEQFDFAKDEKSYIQSCLESGKIG